MTKNTFDDKNHLLNLRKPLKNLYKTIKSKLNFKSYFTFKKLLKKNSIRKKYSMKQKIKKNKRR
jgi:hypothetical protein